MVVTVTEGKVSLAKPADSLIHKEINSCLSLTAVFVDGRRIGAHAVFFPDEEKKMMDLNKLMSRMKHMISKEGGDLSSLFVIGDIQTWVVNDLWFGAATARESLGLPRTTSLHSYDIVDLNGDAPCTTNIRFEATGARTNPFKPATGPLHVRKVEGGEEVGSILSRTW